ncbi:hypothetical protein FACS1894182_11710 [Bacteroidia bacterium]|nr:hypothetical protein FACS1894182_11710 [Bacteroidia bacterium]
MKKAILILNTLVLLLIGQTAFADSAFLTSFNFDLLYKDNQLISETRQTGIAADDYLNFLFSEQQTLGEKVALIEALAACFEWNTDKRDYFREYTRLFKKKLIENKLLTPEMELLETLMGDYQAWKHLNFKRYNQLAKKLPESLTAQSIRVIAFSYYIVYDHIDNLEDEYKTRYLYPYKKAWKNYRQDIKPEVYQNVMSWRQYIDNVQISATGSYGWSSPSDAPVWDTLRTENGARVVIQKTVSGRNLRKTVGTETEVVISLWDEDSDEWKLTCKMEREKSALGYMTTTQDIEYKWNESENNWTEESKSTRTFYYDDNGETVSIYQSQYKWNGYRWTETQRNLMEMKNGETVSEKIYLLNHYGKLVLFDTDTDEFTEIEADEEEDDETSLDDSRQVIFCDSVNITKQWTDHNGENRLTINGTELCNFEKWCVDGHPSKLEVSLTNSKHSLDMKYELSFDEYQMQTILFRESEIWFCDLNKIRAVFIPLFYCGNTDQDTKISYIVLHDNQKYIFHLSCLYDFSADGFFRLNDNLEEKLKVVPSKKLRKMVAEQLQSKYQSQQEYESVFEN